MGGSRRVLLVASWYPGPKAAVRGSFVREQALALASRGYDVHVVNFDRDRVRVPLTWRVHEDEPGLIEHSLGAIFPLHRLVGFYAPELFAARLRTIVAALKPAVVHAHAVRPAGVVAARALSGSDIPLVLTEHSGPLTAFWKTRHGYRQMNTAFAACHARIAVSDALRRNVLQLFPESGPWEVIHNGIDLARFHAAPATARRQALLFVGSLHPVKGVDTLLHSLALLPDEISLTAVGTGPRQAELQALAARLGVHDRVSWLGSRTRDQVAALMREHAALVVASRAETFSLVAAEALASGMPVIATRCGGPEEIVPPDGGFLVPVEDAAAIAQAAMEIFCGRTRFDPATLQHYAVERFSMSSMVDRLEAVYDRVISARSRSCVA